MVDGASASKPRPVGVTSISIRRLMSRADVVARGVAVVDQASNDYRHRALMRCRSFSQLVQRVRGAVRQLLEHEQFARLIPIWDSIARVLIRSARTMLRTAFIER